jgi:flagellar motor switch protein FliN/FliY
MKSSAVEGVKVEISVVLGKAKLPMQQLLRMGRGAVIELEARQNEQVWILANNKLIARGEIMLQGEKIGVSITDMMKSLSSAVNASASAAVSAAVAAPDAEKSE